MKNVFWDDPDPRVVWDNPNFRWGEPSYLLEEGDEGWVPWPPVPISPKPPKKKRSYKMANPTPDPFNELIAAGEDMRDGLENLEVAVGIKQNMPAALSLAQVRQRHFRGAIGGPSRSRGALAPRFYSPG